MAQQTAVALLREALDAEMKMGTKMVVNWDMYLQMEKEQIENAWCNGFDEDDRATSNPLKYYEQTYGGKHD